MIRLRYNQVFFISFPGFFLALSLLSFSLCRSLSEGHVSLALGASWATSRAASFLPNEPTSHSIGSMRFNFLQILIRSCFHMETIQRDVILASNPVLQKSLISNSHVIALGGRITAIELAFVPEESNCMLNLVERKVNSNTGISFLKVVEYSSRGCGTFVLPVFLLLQGKNLTVVDSEPTIKDIQLYTRSLLLSLCVLGTLLFV